MLPTCIGLSYRQYLLLLQPNAERYPHFCNVRAIQRSASIWTLNMPGTQLYRL